MGLNEQMQELEKYLFWLETRLNVLYEYVINQADDDSCEEVEKLKEYMGR